MAFVEVPAQHVHDAIVAKSFESLHGTAIAHDREAKARTGDLAVHEHRAGAAGAVLAAEVRRRHPAPVTQEIGKEICEEKGVPYIDYTRDEEFVGNSQLFKDIFHLNDTGATKFSQLAAIEIGKKLDKKTLAKAHVEN